MAAAPERGSLGGAGRLAKRLFGAALEVRAGGFLGHGENLAAGAGQERPAER